jgi:hypothetical protein
LFQSLREAKRVRELDHVEASAVNLSGRANREDNMASKDPAIVAVFDDRLEAERAVRDLQAAGFDNEQIGFVLRGSDVSQGGMITDAVGTKDGRGAVVGATTGAIVGGSLAAIASLVIPGVGPVVAAGLFGAIFGGAAAGTAVGGILGAMIGLNVSQEEAEYYEQKFREGKAIVAVRTDHNGEEALRILCSRGGYNMRIQRGSSVPTEGFLSQP